MWVDDWTGGLNATLYLPDASTLVGDVQILNWIIARDNGTSAFVSFDLLTVDGSLLEGA
mgnify:CR=1 FL=1